MYSTFSLQVNLEPAVSEALYWAGGMFSSNASFPSVGDVHTELASKPYRKELLQTNLLCELLAIHPGLSPSDHYTSSGPH